MKFLFGSAGGDAEDRPSAERRLEVRQLLKEMPYKYYLLSQHWATIRKNALRRAKFACQLCSDGSTALHVHHNTYERRGHELDSDVIVLCVECHGKFHDVGKK